MWHFGIIVSVSIWNAFPVSIINFRWPVWLLSTLYLIILQALFSLRGLDYEALALLGVECEITLIFV